MASSLFRRPLTRADLDRQVGRLATYATTAGLTVALTVAEIGPTSGRAPVAGAPSEVIGVDMNADHLAAWRLDVHGTVGVEAVNGQAADLDATGAAPPGDDQCGPLVGAGQDIDRALRGIIDEAVRTRATLVEIIPGKGSGQPKKRVLRFLDQKEVRALYHRVEKDSKNFGRLFVHFRWNR